MISACLPQSTAPVPAAQITEALSAVPLHPATQTYYVREASEYRNRLHP